LGIKVTSLGVHNANEIERGITQFALVPNGGLIVAHPVTRGKLIIDLAAHDRLPAIYPFRFHAKDATKNAIHICGHASPLISNNVAVCCTAYFG
jgi:hypothetical protein